MPPFGPPPGDNYRPEVPKPQKLSEVPGYVWKIVSGFFKRLFYIYSLVWETSPLIMIFLVFVAVATGLLPLTGSYISAEIINRLVDAIPIGDSAMRTVMTMLLMQFLFLFVQKLVNIIDTVVTRISGELVVRTIKVKIMKKAKEIDLADFDRPEFYERFENANREAGMRPVQILNATFTLMSSLISMVSFIAVLWGISHAAPFIIVVLAIPSSVVTFIYRKKNVNYMRRKSKDRREMEYYSGVMVNKDLVKEVRLFDLSDVMINRYEKVYNHYFKGLKKLIFAENGWKLLFTLINTAVNCLLFYYVAVLVVRGRIGVGDYTLYSGALSSIMTGVLSLISTTSTIYEGTLFIDNMIVFMNEETTIVPSAAEPAVPQRGKGHSIEFRNVSFRYPETDRDVLKNINLTIREGESLVLVGQNGAGKTTLIKLVTRLYDPTEGEILLDGKNIKEYSLRELYDMYGIIFQDFGRYAFTVKENIAFGEIKDEIDDERIAEAAHRSNADTFIDHLTDGYDTPLMRIFETNGTELSTGQWQKLSVARAFYGKKDIIILDEPTASLDPLAEQEIYRQFDELREGKTTIFVSHRLSNAVNASKIVVLERGEIVEEGTHRELMGLGEEGKYYELFTAQAGRYIENIDVPQGEAGRGNPPLGALHGTPPRGRPERRRIREEDGHSDF